MLGETLRRIGFWTLDALKKGQVKRNYKDIQKKMNMQDLPEKEIREILEYARNNVPFYFEYESEELQNYPVMNKELYSRNYDRMLSSNFFHDKNLHWVRTSGSTGEPFKVPQDANKRNRTKAELLYFHNQSGWNLGDKYLFIRAWIAYNASIAKRTMQNFIAFEATNFKQENIEKLLKVINKNSKLKIVLGYSSILTDFANYLDEKQIIISNKNIKLVVVDSDTLLPGAKEKIEKVFGCPVMNRYDNEEQGVLACMKPGDNFWTVNTASYYIELLKIDEDVPCNPGEVGRVVVTDLTNRAFPFIRYDTGDLAYSDGYDGTYAKWLNGLEGRTKDSILDTEGNRVSGVSFSAYFELFLGVEKYQLIQENEREYSVKVVLKPDMTTDTKEMICKLKECLGQDAKIAVKIVDHIETTVAGKYRPIINRLGII